MSLVFFGGLDAFQASRDGRSGAFWTYVVMFIVDQVVAALEKGGAKRTSYLSGVNTHCIVGTDPDYNEVSEVGVRKFKYPSTFLKYANTDFVTHIRKNTNEKLQNNKCPFFI
jgi:hypothetical protein